MLAIVAAALTGAGVAGPIGVVVAAGAVALVGPVRRVHSQRRAQADRAASLPDAIELLVVGLAAGLTPRQALVLVAERGPPPVRTAFGTVNRRAGAGEPLLAALPRLIDSLGEPVRPLVRAITVAERDGAPVRVLLERLAAEARHQRRHDLEAAIRRLPVRLTFPLAACALPAFVLLTVVPLLAAGLQRLGPISP
jgi:Flp pilus assembly protein TadB